MKLLKQNNAVIAFLLVIFILLTSFSIILSPDISVVNNTLSLQQILDNTEKNNLGFSSNSANRDKNFQIISFIDAFLNNIDPIQRKSIYFIYSLLFLILLIKLFTHLIHYLKVLQINIILISQKILSFILEKDGMK